MVRIPKKKNKHRYYDEDDYEDEPWYDEDSPYEKELHPKHYDYHVTNADDFTPRKKGKGKGRKDYIDLFDKEYPSRTAHALGKWWGDDPSRWPKQNRELNPFKFPWQQDGLNPYKDYNRQYRQQINPKQAIREMLDRINARGSFEPLVAPPEHQIKKGELLLDMVYARWVYSASYKTLFRISLIHEHVKANKGKYKETSRAKIVLHHRVNKVPNPVEAMKYAMCWELGNGLKQHQLQ